MLRHSDRLPRRPRRILVAGVSGSGKNTLAGRIARVTGGNHTEIDALFHGANWILRSRSHRTLGDTNPSQIPRICARA